MNDGANLEHDPSPEEIRAWLKERDRTEDQFTVRIVCDRSADPRHKGKEIHVTELGKKRNEKHLIEWQWYLSKREMSRIERHRGFTAERPNPFHDILEAVIVTHDDPPKAIARHYRRRLELSCPKCDDDVNAREEVARFALDQLQQEGNRQITLSDFRSRLSQSETEKAGLMYARGLTEERLVEDNE